MSTAKVVYAAKASIGNLGYDINPYPDFSTWEVGRYPPTKFNCWTSLLYWAFQGGAISKRFLLNYGEATSGAFQRGNAAWSEETMAKVLGAYRAIILMDHVTPVAGSAVFFQKLGKPMAHVVLSDGTGNVISNDPFFFLGPPGTKQVKLADLKDRLMRPNEGFTAVKHTPVPFWQYLRQ